MNIEMWCRTSALKAYEARPAESIREEGEARAVNGEREGIVQHESAGRCYSTVIKVTAGRRRQLLPCTSALDLSRTCQTHGHQGERNAMAVLSAIPLGVWQCAAMDVCASPEPASGTEALWLLPAGRVGCREHSSYTSSQGIVEILFARVRERYNLHGIQSSVPYNRSIAIFTFTTPST